MENFSLTGWLDPVGKWFSEQSKGALVTEDYTSNLGGEGIANGIQLIFDLFTKGLLNKFGKTFLGAGIGAFAIWGNPNPRLRKELVALANHLEFQLLDPKPRDIIELRQSLDDLISGASLGGTLGMEKVLNSLFVSIDELKEMFAALGAPIKSAFIPVTATIPSLQGATKTKHYL